MKKEELEAKGLDAEQIKFVMSENGKSITKYQKKVEEQDQKLEELQKKLEVSESTLKGFEDADIEGLKAKLEEYETKVAQLEQEAATERLQREYDNAIKNGLEEYTFSSESAKRDVIRQLKEADLKLEDGKLLGLGDLMKKIKEQDKGAFVDVEQKKAEETRIRGKEITTGQKPGKTKLSLGELMKLKNENPKMNIDEYL